METIFLSYRRDDSAGFAGRLAGDLEADLGTGAVFRDVDDLLAGEDFADAITRRLEKVEVILVMIGPQWAGDNGDGTRRIDDPRDFVCLEIKTALASGRPVVPILVGGASMPAAKDLPGDLQPLARLQAVELSDSRWHHDLKRLQAQLNPAKPKPRLWALAWPAKRNHRLALWAAIAMAAVTLGLYSLPAARPLKIDGIWRMPGEGHWAITRNDDRLDVEVFVPGWSQAWMRGTGHVEGDTLKVTLLPQYDNPYHHRFACELALDKTGRVLSGTMRELTRGGETPLDLNRP